MKNIIVFFSFIILIGCGFEPMYSNKNNIDEKYYFEEINYEGEKKLSSLFKTALRSKIIKKENLKNKINILNSLEKTTVSKDASGDPSVLELRVKLIVEIINNETSEVKKNTLNESFRYNNIDNQFDLQMYEDDITKDIVNKLSRKILIILRNIN